MSKLIDMRFTEFDVIERGVRYRLNPHEVLSDWLWHLVAIARMPIQIPISFRAANQLFFRLAEEAGRSRDEFAVAKFPEFGDLLRESGFHVLFEKGEIEFSDRDYGDLLEGSETNERLNELETWLRTCPEDALAKLGGTCVTHVREVVLNRLQRG